MTRAQTKIHAVALLILLSASITRAIYGVSSCDGISSGAKYRYQWMYQVKDPTEGNKKALHAAMLELWKEQCKKAIKYGHGPALTTNQAAFGFAQGSAPQEFADYGTWSDWASIADLEECLANTRKSGAAAAIRAFSKKVSRVVYDLSTNTGSARHNCTSGSLAPAKVRAMFNLMFKEQNQDTCKKTLGLQAVIMSAKGSDALVRHAYGCDVIVDDAKTHGSGITNTADYGGYYDFKDLSDMTKFLSNHDPSVADARKSLRGLTAPDTSMRIAIALQ